MICDDTPIVPRAVAEAVWEEACVQLRTELPRRWVHRLILRAETVYRTNRSFQRALRSSGEAGRDRLGAYMRHWLADLIRRQRPELFPRLPDGYAVGAAMLQPDGATRV